MRRSVPALVLCLVSLLLSGCARSGPPAAPKPRIAHVVMSSVRELYEGVSETDPLVRTSEREVWADGAAPMRRVDSRSRHPGETDDVRVSLIRDGVETIVDHDHEGRVTAWKMDAALSESGPAGEYQDPMERGDLGYYRRLVDEGKAKVVGSGEVSGTPTTRVRFEHGTEGRGVTVLVDVRTTDYVPLRLDGDSWYDVSGARKTTHKWRVRYDVAEWVSRAEVPPGTFELQVPKGVYPYADLPLSPRKAASYDGLRGYWLGESFGGQKAVLLYRGRPPAPGHFGGMPAGPADEADNRRPDFAGRWIEAEYSWPASFTAEGMVDRRLSRDIKVISYPKLARSAWPSFGRGVTTATVSIGGHDALRCGWEGATPHTYWFVLDLDDATVVVQCVGATSAEWEAAIAAVRHVK